MNIPGTILAINTDLPQYNTEVYPEVDSEVDSNSEAFSCGHWFPFKDEKCFQVYTNVESYADAERTCRKAGAILGVIRSAEEQDVINRHLKDNNIVDNIWIGLTQNENKSFAWTDGSALTYTNWMDDSPLNADCVVISVDFTRSPFAVTDWKNYGKWLAVNCAKKNAVLCQNIQPWSITKIQNELMKTRNEHTQEIINLKANPVPIGFIYIQVSGQSDPQTLWPSIQWQDVTESYAGQFFRAEGGGSAGFGEVQEQQTQSLNIWTAGSGGHIFHSQEYRVTSSPNDAYIFTGADNGVPENYYGLRIYQGSEEIRPRNQAVRIWKRVA